jgi:hypothetical protein
MKLVKLEVSTKAREWFDTFNAKAGAEHIGNLVALEAILEILRELKPRRVFDVGAVRKGGPFILTKIYPTKNLALAEELYSTAVEKPGEDPVLRAVISVWEARTKVPSAKNIRKKRR